MFTTIINRLFSYSKFKEREKLSFLCSLFITASVIVWIPCLELYFPGWSALRGFLVFSGGTDSLWMAFTSLLRIWFIASCYYFYRFYASLGGSQLTDFTKSDFDRHGLLCLALWASIVNLYYAGDPISRPTYILGFFLLLTAVMMMRNHGCGGGLVNMILLLFFLSWRCGCYVAIFVPKLLLDLFDSSGPQIEEEEMPIGLAEDLTGGEYAERASRRINEAGFNSLYSEEETDEKMP